ncbi:PREDICTED: hepatic triacylglycerol lipase [Chinchilla lanigera]|uniref:Hepatic triacylglycerol lipase n=1 Tax=Chinchilla lanigera TaxID=34839 RepID=A0A8C2VBD9_CHILA|nr:PREDICTED: hepatic triacylglycerol lipase [Chinchilla lanigera]XP_005393896.1 PREDICTED: hepatic triacylglycerol lipase [Chinchilla lanigera]XP_005393897.1 PREDICTED: hepatic triacylglycerol lipase [Chinchilla lanigera]
MGGTRRVAVFLVVCIFTQSRGRGQSLEPEPLGRRPQAVETKKALQKMETRFLLLPDGHGQGCEIGPHRPGSLQECGFNSSRPLVLIIHGWSVDGVLESWVHRLVAALRTQPVNVGLADWLALAHHHYAVAVRNARLVGQEVAATLRWLEESVHLSPSSVHLIGYSLGAHVAGFAGSYVGGRHKIGRITGLDAAGPLFEGMSPRERLSLDDAAFVDAIHTFTREHMGLSVGIKQPIAHYDFYPNGGRFQPGCHFLELYKHLAQHGLNAIPQTIKCAHERAVHLFIDSLLHEDAQSTGYQCSGMGSFSQGLCLDCRKGRCNSLGYHARKPLRAKSKSLFLLTRAQAPFRVYHYQFKIQFINQTEKPEEPTFTLSLLGTKEDMQQVPVTLGKGITSNQTYSFLVTLELDVGELVLVKLRWERGAVWTSVWNTVQAMVPWGGDTRSSSSGLSLALGTIRVKAGETQQRMTFCSENKDDLLHPAQEKTFVRCEVNSKTLKRKIS